MHAPGVRTKLSEVDNVKPFANILCVLVPGETCTAAVERAVTLAENNQASLTVIDVIDHIESDIELPKGKLAAADVQSTMARIRTQELQSLVDPYRERLEIRLDVLNGTPFLEIIREVLRGGFDLVIKVAEKQEWTVRMFGSDDLHLLRQCPCPVWLIKPSAPKSYRRIVAAVDVDDVYPQDDLQTRRALNGQILERAGSLALADFAELHVVTAWEAAGEGVMRGAFMRMPDVEIAAYV
jgi:universal stress protein E